MIIRMLRGALAVAVSALVIPYTISIVSNILNGWPKCRHKYRRALNPSKVLALNYVLVQMLRDKTRFIPLYLKWKKFYRNADSRRLYKNLTFGRNDCTLDVYLPSDRKPGSRLPVIIFVYGGAWSSGDKSSYGLLCSNIVAATNTVAVCPNYSTYPKGYVDDMIQDLVDSIAWTIDNIHEYGGDKDKIILIGHSAGAHLASMAILELLYDERLSVKPSFRFEPAGRQLEQLSFTDSHYGRVAGLSTLPEGLEESSGSSESFAVVSENGSSSEQNVTGAGDETRSMPGFEGGSMSSEWVQTSFSQDGAGECVTFDEKSHSMAEEPVKTDASLGQGDVLEKEDYNNEPGDSAESQDKSRSRSHSGSLRDEEEDSDDDDSVVTVRPKDIERHATLVDMCKCIKAFIGLAGVYSISEHFQHESMRGIEDVSSMCRAHYGEDHFARFSPKEIIRSLGRCLSLPLMILVHGMCDYVIPISSSLTFADALADISGNVKVKIIPDCDHYEICLDLMDKQRTFYSHVMSIIMDTVAAVS